MKRVVGVVFLAVLLFGCAGSKKMTKPAWVDGAQYMADALQGVGVAPKMVTPAAQRERAAHQARLDLARQLRTRVAGLIRDWVNENKDYFQDAGESLSYYESVSEELTQATLVGAHIQEYWKDPEDGSLYALAVLSKTDAVAALMDKMKALSTEQSTLIRERADDAFKKLDEKLQQANW